MLSLLDASQDTSVTQEDSKMGESLWNWWNMVRNSHVLDVERIISSSAVFSRIVSAGHP